MNRTTYILNLYFNTRCTIFNITIEEFIQILIKNWIDITFCVRRLLYSRQQYNHFPRILYISAVIFKENVHNTAIIQCISTLSTINIYWWHYFMAKNDLNHRKIKVIRAISLYFRDNITAKITAFIRIFE